MKTIYKYPVRIADEFTIEMPSGARLLDVQVHSVSVYLWALIDTDSPHAVRRLALRGTGHDAGDLDSAVYIGTFQLTSGNIVFHLFDRGDELLDQKYWR